MVSTTLNWIQRHPVSIIVGFALFLGFLGTREMVDGIGLWIVGFVDSLPSSAWYQPFHPPPPSYGYGFRPISIILVKGYIALFGVQTPPPLWFLFSKISISAAIYGLSCWMWLQAVGQKRAAVGLSILGMMLSPHLFALWYLTELDGLGAATTLIASTILLMPERSRKQLWVLGFCIFFTIFLKESSALLLFSILAVHALYFGIRGQTKPLLTTISVLLLALAIWLIMAWKVVTGHVEGHFSELSLTLRWTIVGYTATQFTVFVSLMGVVLIGLLALHRYFAKWNGWRWIILLVIFSAFLWPPVSILNHYETWYFDQGYWMIGGGLLLNIALVFFLIQGKKEPMRALMALLILAMEGVMSSALLMSANPREDIAARLFLVGFPPMAVLTLEAVNTLKKSMTNRYERIIFYLAPTMAVWFVVSSSINTLIRHHARNQVDVPGHERLGGKIKQSDLVLFDNFIFWLSRDAIKALAPESIMLEDPQLVYVPSQLRKDYLPRVNWGEDVNLESLDKKGQRMWLYSLQIRGEMTAKNHANLKGNFKDLRHPFGLFKPFGSPTDKTSLPSTSYIEDSRAITYGQHPTPLANLFDARGTLDWVYSGHFIQLAPMLNEWPQKWLSGTPIIEDYSYRVELRVLNDQ